MFTCADLFSSPLPTQFPVWPHCPWMRSSPSFVLTLQSLFWWEGILLHLRLKKKHKRLQHKQETKGRFKYYTSFGHYIIYKEIFFYWQDICLNVYTYASFAFITEALYNVFTKIVPSEPAENRRGGWIISPCRLTLSTDCRSIAGLP